jgi:hypothetical protein|tara:strand:- start:62 stop:379 length:318 start_codon:yes stop_codon:yes gene_type:complete
MKDSEYIKMKKMERNHETVTTTKTPLHTTDWYIKWVASVTLLFGMILTSNNIYPLNIFVHMIGLIGWLVVSLMWNDRALIVINAVGVAIMANGLVGYFVESGIWQ